VAKAFAKGGLAIDVGDLEALRHDLAEVSKDLPRQIRLANKKAAEIMAQTTAAKAHQGTGQQAKLAPTIRAGATQMAGKVVIGSARLPFAMAAFMGSRSRTGWFADNRFSDYGPIQFPPWVGNQWDPGESWDGHASGEPYILGDAIRSSKDQFLEEYTRLIDEVLDRAFPN
jgi:hypothetical protein